MRARLLRAGVAAALILGLASGWLAARAFPLPSKAARAIAAFHACIAKTPRPYRPFLELTTGASAQRRLAALLAYQKRCENVSGVSP